MAKSHIEADAESEKWNTSKITGSMKVSTIEVDFDGLIQERLEKSRKVVKDEYKAEGDGAWAASYNAGSIRGFEQRTAGTAGQGVSGQSGQEDACISGGQYSILLEQPELGKRPTATNGKEMEIGSEGGPFFR